MKTKFFVMAAMAALFSMGFTACSNNDEDLTAKADLNRGDAISLKAYGNNSLATRGDATNAGQLQFTDFQTWAYDASTNALYMGTSATSGVEVAYNSTADDLLGNWIYNPAQFWPVNELNFVAIAPKNAAASNSTSSTTGVVTLASTLNIGTTVSAQKDIMFACGKNNPEAPATPVKGPVAKADYNGDVPLVFEHALSQIVFQGKIATGGAITKVVIDEITLGNIGSAGVVNFTSAGTWFDGTNAYIPTTATANYSLAGSMLEGDTFEDGVSGITAGTAFDLTQSNSATSKSNAMFLLPQRTAAWEYRADPTAPATAADKLKLKAGGMVSAPASGAYLKIAADLYKGTVKILDKTDAIYIPLTISWDRGKKYTYIIDFNGLSALTPITFSVTAEDWDPVTPGTSVQM